MARILLLFVMVSLASLCCLVRCYDMKLCEQSDGTGTCNTAALAGLPDDKAADAQDYMLLRFGEIDFAGGDKPGCYSRDFDHFTAYGYFGCDDEGGTKCRDCYKAASERLKEGCRGRAGGRVLRDSCCFRYESENICYGYHG